MFFHTQDGEQEAARQDARATFEVVGHITVCAMLLFTAACSENDPLNNDFDNEVPGNNAAFDMGFGGSPGADAGTQEPPFIPEIEEDFTFSQPAVVGSEVFIANETLNSVAVIDSTALAIRTLPVGFRPTVIVGPARGANTDASRVVVLNEGSSTVSIIDPATRQSTSLNVMAGANALAANQESTACVAWYNDGLFEEGDVRGDLSSVTIIKQGVVYQVAVGFHVREVRWVKGTERVLILSDDGVSVVDVSALTQDRVQIPVPVIPRELVPRDPRDLEVLVDVTGLYAVARISTFSGVVITSLEDGSHDVVNLPEIPTDIDMVGGERPGVMVMLPRSEAALVMSLPVGAANAALVTAVSEEEEDMGMPLAEDMSADMSPEEDMADVPADMASDDMSDMAFGDMGPVDMDDMGAADMSFADMSFADMSFADMSADMSIDADMAADMSPTPVNAPLAILEGVEGVDVLALPEGFRLGAAVISEGGEQALIYTTLNGGRLGVLYDFEDGEARSVFFEKGIKAVVADERGKTFVAFHSRDESATTDVIAKSWGLSVVDVNSATPRLVITEHEPWRATLWSVEGFSPRAYVIFKRPVDQELVVASQRDVLGVNLDSFSVSTFRVASPPEGIGAIPAAGRVYINQTHPQGRMTFVDVASARQQTVTGYQLNARID